MATTVLKAPPTFWAPSANARSASSSPLTHVCLAHSKFRAVRRRISRRGRDYSVAEATKLGRSSFWKFLTFATDGDSVEAQTETQEKEPIQESEPEAEDKESDDVAIDASIDSDSDGAVAEDTTSSLILASLTSYKEALANNDEAKIAEIESYFQTVEDEVAYLERKLATVTEELSYERDRVLRISADFDNFRKRTERDRLSLVTNAQGELVERLLPVLDNFERAKAQIKVDTEGEEKVSNSYQSIYKQFVEILGSLGVVPVETVGKPFDPMMHEAIVREDSTEYEDGVIIEEYRKGFILGERLLRPSMVKVSAGPGPDKPETENWSEDQKEGNETNTNEEEANSEAEPASE